MMAAAPLSRLSITGCVLLLMSSVRAVEITTPPQNAVSLTGTGVQLTCGLSQMYSSYFEWRAYIGDKHGGTQIYFSPPFTPKSPRYHQFGDFGLEIRPVEWRDAGKYSCVFLTGDSRKSANIVVMEKPVVHTPSTPLVVGQSVELSCNVSFGGPEMDATSPPDTVGMFPQVRMSLGPDRPLDSSAAPRHTPGQPGVTIHQLILSVTHTVSMEDVGRSLTCSVSTTNPEFSTETVTTLNIQAPVNEVRVEPLLREYSVGDVINCSANGWPAPSIMWRQMEGPPAQGSSDGQALIVREEMRASRNVWKCIATNGFSGDELTITFNVTLAGSGVGGQTGENGGGSNLGLAVGLPLVILLILAVAGVIVFLFIRRRRQQGGKPEKKVKTPFISGTDQDADFRANGGKQPIYQPRPTGLNRGRVASTDEPRDSPLDRSLGYADLGIGLVRQASCERLDEHDPVDTRGRGVPRQEPVSNRAEGPFSDSWQDPNARHYKNVPIHSVDGDSDAAPFSPQGFADIGGGLHGSRQSLNRVSDGSRQAAPSGSLNRSQDSATGAAAHPRPRGRDAVAARGSNRSLEGSSDSSEAAARRPPGVSRQADPTRPPAHPQPPCIYRHSWCCKPGI